MTEAPPATQHPPAAPVVAAADVPPAVDVEGLTKRFRSGQVAVDSLDLHVPAGSVFGFLGPNGSGKTTTIRMLLGLVAPTAGQVRLLGRPMPEAARDVLPQVGALIEGPGCYPFLSGRNNLRRFDAADRDARTATREARVAAALERVGLANAAEKKFRAYSLGMRQRLGLAAALLQPRRLLVLDEPTNGLDPQGTREVRSLVRGLAAEGTTVFLSSHLLSEIEQLCTHVAMMSRGRLVATGTVPDLLARSPARLRVETPDPARGAQVLARLGLSTVDAGGGALAVDLAGSRLLPEDVCAALVHDEVRVRSLESRRPSLEDLFVELTGQGFDIAE